MAPALWASALAAGAHGITFATPWQARAGLSAGVTRVMLANNLVDAAAIASLAATLDERPEAELWVWADSDEAVSALVAGLDRAGATRPVDVLVDLGAPGGRTGARSIEAAMAVAERVRAEPALRLRGAAGYEGPFGSDRSEESVAAVRAYLASLASLYERMRAAALFDVRPILTAGGSSYPDLVVEAFARFAPEADVVIRSGAFQVHDSGFYERMSPFRSAAVPDPLEPAIHVWARVVSAPEPGLVLLDAGRRDVPVDIDPPVVEAVLGRAGDAVPDVVVTAVNDQHAFVRGPGTGSLAVGDVVRLGLSHPCTAFDKWRAVVEISGADEVAPRVTGAFATLF
jgi:D-serine deaminase-like pyridoxal phosphate-dependent protein